VTARHGDGLAVNLSTRIYSETLMRLKFPVAVSWNIDWWCDVGRTVKKVFVWIWYCMLYL